jgi:hypothetical protein
MLRKCRVPKGLLHHDPVFFETSPAPSSHGVWVDIGHGLWVLLTPIWDEVEMWVPVLPGEKEGNSAAFQYMNLNTNVHIFIKHANVISLSKSIMDSCTRTSISMEVTVYMTYPGKGAGTTTITHTETNAGIQQLNVSDKVHLVTPKDFKKDDSVETVQTIEA